MIPGKGRQGHAGLARRRGQSLVRVQHEDPEDLAVEPPCLLSQQHRGIARTPDPPPLGIALAAEPPGDLQGDHAAHRGADHMRGLDTQHIQQAARISSHVC